MIFACAAKLLGNLEVGLPLGVARASGGKDRNKALELSLWCRRLHERDSSAIFVIYMCAVTIIAAALAPETRGKVDTIKE